MDRLCRYEEGELRNISVPFSIAVWKAEICLGSGNSIANYVPLKIILLCLKKEEITKYRRV